MTYKLITEDKLKQALDDAQSTINSLVDFDRELTSQGDQHSKKAKACEGSLLAAQNLYETLRAVMEREGPKLEAWASANVIPIRGMKDNHPCILTATQCAANPVPLYTLPDEPTT